MRLSKGGSVCRSCFDKLTTNGNGTHGLPPFPVGCGRRGGRSNGPAEVRVSRGFEERPLRIRQQAEQGSRSSWVTGWPVSLFRPGRCPRFRGRGMRFKQPLTFSSKVPNMIDKNRKLCSSLLFFRDIGTISYPPGGAFQKEVYSLLERGEK